MRLSELAPEHFVAGTADPELSGLTEDSRRITAGMLFVAVPGTVLDGHSYISDALTRGAAAVVSERAVDSPRVACLQVPSARCALASMAARFYGEPAAQPRDRRFHRHVRKDQHERHPLASCSQPVAPDGFAWIAWRAVGAFYDTGKG